MLAHRAQLVALGPVVVFNTHGLRPSCNPQYTHGLRPSCCSQYTHGLRPSCESQAFAAACLGKPPPRSSRLRLGSIIKLQLFSETIQRLQKLSSPSSAPQLSNSDKTFQDEPSTPNLSHLPEMVQEMCCQNWPHIFLNSNRNIPSMSCKIWIHTWCWISHRNFPNLLFVLIEHIFSIMTKIVLKMSCNVWAHISLIGQRLSREVVVRIEPIFRVVWQKLPN